MKTYIGKQIKAKPMSRVEYHEYMRWDMPTLEYGATPGMLVEYVGEGECNHSGHDGHISWLPIDVFNHNYRPADDYGPTFCLASATERAEARRALVEQEKRYVNNPGLSIENYDILVCINTLNTVDQLCSVKDVHTSTWLKKLTIKRRCAEMENEGLITSLVIPGYKKSKSYHLTEKGVDLIENRI